MVRPHVERVRNDRITKRVYVGSHSEEDRSRMRKIDTSKRNSI